MAIVEMRKLAVVGLNSGKQKILSELMYLGAAQIDSQDKKLLSDDWAALVKQDEGNSGPIESEIAEASSAIGALDKYFSGIKPLIVCRKPVGENEFNDRAFAEKENKELANKVNSLYKKILSLKAEENTVLTNIAGLKPWVSYSYPLDMRKTRLSAIQTGTFPVSVSLSDVEEKLSKVKNGGCIYQVSKDENLIYAVFVCLREDEEELAAILRQEGFNPVAFEGLSGTAQSCLEESEKRLETVKKDIASSEDEMRKLSDRTEELKFYYDGLVIERDKQKILSNLLKTKSAFYFDGWITKSSEEEVKAVLDKYGCYYEISEPEKGEEFPILLKENALTEPFEAITDLYSTPSVNDIDPTPFLAPFYFIFFGLMLSDAAYGAILTIGSFIILKMFNIEGLMKKIMKLFMYCGISTMFWGIMFGGVFGDMFGISALWFNPVEDPMTLLVFSLIFGGIHLFVGMGIKAYILIKSGHMVDAVCDIFLWYILLIGLVLFGVGNMITPVLSEIGKYMSIIGAVGILFTGGRSKKGIGKITGGLGSLYGITSYLSDVLSYSRLLALGLATGVVSQVINTLGKMLGGGIVAIVAMVIVFIIGHVFNLAINTLGSFVHSSRLQYVEFFGKFFEGGGTAFNPFKRRTKYVEIVKEEK